MDDLAFWRDIALVFLLIQLFVGVLLAVSLSYLLVRLTNGLQGHAQRAANKARALTSTVAGQTDVYSRKVTEPVVKLRSQGARIGETMRTLVQTDAPPLRHTEPGRSDTRQHPGAPS